MLNKEEYEKALNETIERSSILNNCCACIDECIKDGMCCFEEENSNNCEDYKCFSTIKQLIKEHFELVEEHEKYKKALHNAIKECCINVRGSDACNSLDELYKAFEKKVWEDVE